MSGISVKRVLTSLVALSVQAPGWSAEFDGGTGEAEDPYRIATAEQLVSTGSDATLMDKHFVLLNDIDLDPNLLLPVVMVVMMILLRRSRSKTSEMGA